MSSSPLRPLRTLTLATLGAGAALAGAAPGDGASDAGRAPGVPASLPRRGRGSRRFATHSSGIVHRSKPPIR